MNAILRSIHRYISLAVALVWVIQAVTGLLMVFHREVEELAFPQPEAPADFDAIGQSLHAVLAANPGSRIPFIYTAGQDTSRLDVYVTDPQGSYRVLRMDGDGRILRDLPSNPEVLDAGFFELVLELHNKLLFGDRGHLFIGLSGIVLLTNLGLGLKLAWPRAGQWRRSLRLPKPRSSAAVFYQAHRALGLWLVIPAMVTVTAGTMIVWSDYLAEWWDVMPAPVVAADESAVPPPVSVAQAVDTAMRQYPGAGFTALNLPSADAPYYKVRLVQDEELRAIFGMTTVYVDARSGDIIADYDAVDAPLHVSMLNAFYPIHTGAALGLASRIVLFLVGIWLLAMITLGVSLWLKKRARKSVNRGTP